MDIPIMNADQDRARFEKAAMKSPVENARASLANTRIFLIFVGVSTVFALAEPILVGFPATGSAYTAQKVVLGISTLLFFIGLLMTISVMKSTDTERVETVGAKLAASFDSEVVIEVICLLIGWTCIFEAPGIAALRCFRVFRLLWYFELFAHEHNEDEYDPTEHPLTISKACQLCLEYLEKVGVELFTEASKGGMIIIGLYFYVTYIMAVVSWNVEGSLDTTEGHSCSSVRSCFLTMMRLSLYDGTGFDFLKSVIDNGNGGLGFLLILYMCFNAMILLNGLIGVFGSSFQTEEAKKKKDDDVPESTKILRSLLNEVQSMRADVDNIKRRVGSI
jgi:hypothetical protein